MFSKKSLILILIITNCIIDLVKPKNQMIEKMRNRKIDKNVKKEEPKKPQLAKLKPEQIEFGKKFFKGLVDDQEKAMKGAQLNYTKSLRVEKGAKIEDFTKDQEITDENKAMNAAAPESPVHDDGKHHAPLQPTKGGIPAYRNMPSGGTVFLDGLISFICSVGDPYTGLPDGIISLGKWCIEFWIKGAIIVIYTTIRFPHKLFLKVMVLTGAVNFIPLSLMWCLNPVSIAQFISKAKIVNRNFDDLADIQYKMKVRVANTLDKVYNMRDIQKISCCAWHDYRTSSVDVVDEEAKPWLKQYFMLYSKLAVVIYCGDYQEQEDCKDVEFDDSDPIRVIPRSHIALYIEIFNKFF